MGCHFSDPVEWHSAYGTMVLVVPQFPVDISNRSCRSADCDWERQRHRSQLILYTILAGSQSVARFNMLTQQPDFTWPVPNTTANQLRVSPHSLAMRTRSRLI